MSDEKVADVEPQEESKLDAELSALEAEAAPDQSVIESEKKEAADQKRLMTAKDEFFGVLKMGLSPLPGILCPNWGIQSVEIDALCEAYAIAFAKQFPEGIGEVGPWVGAGITTLAIVGPRLAIPPRKPKDEERGAVDGSAKDTER